VENIGPKIAQEIWEITRAFQWKLWVLKLFTNFEP